MSDTSPAPRYLAPMSRAEMIGVRFDEGDGTEGGSGPAGKTFSEDYVKTLRAESASYRTALRTAEQERDALKVERDAAVTAKTAAEQKAADAEAKIAAASVGETRRAVAATVGLTAEQAEFLSGTTEDEIKASAEKYKKANGITDTPTIPGQGHQEQTKNNGSESPLQAALRRAATGNANAS